MDLPFSTEDLTRLYRFALLLTGEDAAAQQVLIDACLDCAPRVAAYRNERSRLACILANLRQKAKGLSPAEASGLPGAFAALPEEQRVALAGLYSGLLPAHELAEVLKLSLEQLAARLKSARESLERDGFELPTLEEAL